MQNLKFVIPFLLTLTMVGCLVTKPATVLDRNIWDRTDATFNLVFDNLKSHKLHGGYLSIHDIVSGEGFGLDLKDVAVDGDIKIADIGTVDVLIRYLVYYQRNGGQELLNEIEAIAEVLVGTQNIEGGWGYWGMTKRNLSQRRTMATEKIKALTSFDEGITPMMINFLIDLHRETEDKKYIKPIDRGISVVLKSQNSDGGWPQYYPSPDFKYGAYSSLNDETSNMCFRALLKYREEQGRLNVDSAIIKYNEFLLSYQSRLGAWAQQYDPSGNAVGARVVEPAAFCSFCTGKALEDLIELKDLLITKHLRQENLNAMQAAEVWLARSKLSNGRWARFYDLQTGKPFFADSQGKIYNSLVEAQNNHAAFKGYAYDGYFDIPNLLARLDGWRKSGLPSIDAYLASQSYGSDYKVQKAKILMDELMQKKMLDPLTSLRNDRYWHLNDALRALDYVNSAQTWLLSK